MVLITHLCIILCYLNNLKKEWELKNSYFYKQIKIRNNNKIKLKIIKMSIAKSLKIKLKKVKYPIEVIDYNSQIQKMAEETRKLQSQYSAPPPEMEEYEGNNWYKKNKNLVLRYIREGKLAPIDEMMGEDDETTCIVCMSSISNKASGYNLIQCSNNPENH